MSPVRKEARLIVLETGESISLDTSPITIGRHDPTLQTDPDINLTSRTVGRRHARIAEKQDYLVEDLNSINKTRLNGVVLTPGQEYALHDGDLLQFGRVKVRFEYS